jgi:hypothetical protein
VAWLMSRLQESTYCGWPRSRSSLLDTDRCSREPSLRRRMDWHSARPRQWYRRRRALPLPPLGRHDEVRSDAGPALPGRCSRRSVRRSGSSRSPGPACPSGHRHRAPR